MSKLLRDVIAIPERVGAEDYVLRLSDSVGNAAQRTLDEYVVTPALRESFDDALGLVGNALTTNNSRGAFLTGSFGSGKSHFMAVLHTILRNDTVARAKPELQGVIARHEKDLAGKKILPLTFHMLGAKSMEQAIFDGYLRQIGSLHPTAPKPSLHETDNLFTDADGMRERLGDEKFFAGLGGDGADDEWGEFLGSGAWDAARYDAARNAAAGDADREKLAMALVEHYFSSYGRMAEFIDLDSGLAAISQHAKNLGYDAVVLFLDELVLWLAFSVQNREFFAREAQKITKFVESSVGNRAIPLVSFIARQMNLQQWFADAGASGSEQTALDQAFRHQEGRFSTIQLGDDNLPYVANQRLLQPVDDSARQDLARAFEGIDRRAAVWDVLLDGVNTDEQHRGADSEAFKLTYPFSPALVSTLRALAGVMQRERTALKVMQRMLVERRENLTIDDVIPVGDAFSIIVQGESGQALDATAAARFKAAERIYREKLRPVVLKNKGIADEESLAEASDATKRSVAADDRLAKTLLMSAVAPNVPALRDLTGQRLASLNHGSIVSPLPGTEASIVLGTVRKWAAEVPEIKIDGDGPNSVIAVQLTDVDYESIVEKAKGEDNEGRRRETINDIVSAAIGLPPGTQKDIHGAYPMDIVWRGTQRRIDILFGNVRDRSYLSDDHFRAAPGTWRVVIDHPFDDAGHSVAEDMTRIEELKNAQQHSRTLVWLPHFFSDETMRDLRRYVILQWLLDASVERFASYSDHLREGDRQMARAILEGQRTNLRESLTNAVRQAYGIDSPRAGVLSIDESHDKVIASLDTTFTQWKVEGPSLGHVFTRLVGDAFSATYPKHPTFEPQDEPVKGRDYKAVADALGRAVDEPYGRLALSSLPNAASVRRVAGPLGVATVNDQLVVFSENTFVWGGIIERGLGVREQAGIAASEPVRVGELREWISSDVLGQGLPNAAVDLVIIAWAQLRQRGWPVGVQSAIEPGKLVDVHELRSQPLPDPAAWLTASERAEGLFASAKFRGNITVHALNDAEKAVHEGAKSVKDAQAPLVAAIESAYTMLGLELSGGRFETARRTGELVQKVHLLTGKELIDALAAAHLSAGPAAGGKSLRTAAEVTRALRDLEAREITSLREIAAGGSDQSSRAQALIDRLVAVVQQDEFVTPLVPEIKAFRDGYIDVLRRMVVVPTPTPEPVVPTPVQPTPHAVSPPQEADERSIRPGESGEAVLHELRQFLEANRGAKVSVSWKIDE